MLLYSLYRDAYKEGFQFFKLFLAYDSPVWAQSSLLPKQYYQAAVQRRSLSAGASTERT